MKTAIFNELQRQLQGKVNRDTAEQIKKLEDWAWSSDISPEAYYNSPVREIAREKVNYKEKMEAIKEEITFYLDVIENHGEPSKEHVIKHLQRGIESLEEIKRKTVRGEVTLWVRRELLEKIQ